MLILASQSPRRAELLQQLQVPFTAINVGIDETPRLNELSTDYVLRLAIEKAQAGARVSSPSDWVLGADTVVVGHWQNEQQLLGKPRNFADARRMWQMLSGTQHQVLTAVALVSAKQIRHCLVNTHVWFKDLSESEMQWYWSTGEPQDKAGGYGIQGLAGQFITRIEGSYSAVVGLPLYETSELIKQMEK